MHAVIIIKLWSRKLVLHCSLAAAIWRPPYYWSWAFISFFLAELWKCPTLGLEVGKTPKPDQLQRNSRNSVLTTTTHLLGTYTQYHYPPFVIFTVFYLILLDPILPWAYCVNSVFIWYFFDFYCCLSAEAKDSFSPWWTINIYSFQVFYSIL